MFREKARARFCWAKERDPVWASLPRELVSYKLRTCSPSTDWEQWTCSPYEPAEPPMLRDPWWQDIQEQGKSEHGHNRGIGCCLKFDVSWLGPALGALCLSRLSRTCRTSSPVRGCCRESTPSSKTRYRNVNAKPLEFEKFKIATLIRRVCIKSNQKHHPSRSKSIKTLTINVTLAFVRCSSAAAGIKIVFSLDGFVGLLPWTGDVATPQRSAGQAGRARTLLQAGVPGGAAHLWAILLPTPQQGQGPGQVEHTV